MEVEDKLATNNQEVTVHPITHFQEVAELRSSRDQVKVDLNRQLAVEKTSSNSLVQTRAKLLADFQVGARHLAIRIPSSPALEMKRTSRSLTSSHLIRFNRDLVRMSSLVELGVPEIPFNLFLVDKSHKER